MLRCVPTLEAEHEVNKRNLEIADKSCALKLMIGAIHGWFKLNPGKGYQDLEKYFRQEKFNTFVIAKNCSPDGHKLKMINKYPATDLKYQSLISCLPSPYAENEMLSYSNTYQENFEKLALTGDLAIDVEHFVKLTENKMAELELLSENMLKIVPAIPVEQCDLLNKRCQEKYGKWPIWVPTKQSWIQICLK